MLVAGGTDLLPEHEAAAADAAGAGRRCAACASCGARRTGTAWSLGAGLTLTADRAQTPRASSAAPGCWQAAAQIATPPLRNMGTLGGNLCLDTRCNYYDQNYEWRKAIDFCMKKDGEHVLGRAGEPTLLGGLVDRHRADADGARRRGAARLGGRRALDRDRGPLPQRRHRLPDAAPRRDADAIECRPRRGGAAPTGSCAAAGRSTSRCCRWPPRCASAPTAPCEAARIVLGAVARARWPRPRPRPRSSIGALRRRRDRRRRRRRLRSRQADGQHRLRPRLAQAHVREFVAYALRELRGDDMRETRLKLARQALTIVH